MKKDRDVIQKIKGNEFLLLNVKTFINISDISDVDNIIIIDNTYNNDGSCHKLLLELDYKISTVTFGGTFDGDFYILDANTGNAFHICSDDINDTLDYFFTMLRDKVNNTIPLGSTIVYITSLSSSLFSQYCKMNLQQTYLDPTEINRVLDHSKHIDNVYGRVYDNAYRELLSKLQQDRVDEKKKLLEEEKKRQEANQQRMKDLMREFSVKSIPSKPNTDAIREKRNKEFIEKAMDKLKGVNVEKNPEPESEPKIKKWYERFFF